MENIAIILVIAMLGMIFFAAGIPQNAWKSLKKYLSESDK